MPPLLRDARSGGGVFISARRIFLALSSGLLLVLSFPPYDLGYLAWVALVPFLAALEDSTRRWAIGLSILTSTVFMMGVFRWILIVKSVTLPDFLLLDAYFMPYFLFFAALVRGASRSPDVYAPLIAGAGWVAMEYIRSNAGFLGLPMAILGQTQYRYPAIIQIAAVGGTYGVSFLLVFTNAAIWEGMRAGGRGGETPVVRIREFLRGAAPSFVLVGACAAYGFLVLGQPAPRKTLPVSVVQGNIPQTIKWDVRFREMALERHVRLSEAAGRDAETALIVWPELSVPGLLSFDPRILAETMSVARKTGAHLLLGGAQRSKFAGVDFRDKNRFNSAILMSPAGRILQQYNKILLLPFGEYLPMKGWFPWPERLARDPGHIPGKEYTLFQVRGARFGVPICWESVFPDHFRRFVDRGADFMVNITNEAWFEGTGVSYQFLAINVMRAVENRVSLVRCANTGISCFINPRGEVAARVSRDGKDLSVEGYRTMEVPLREERTFYTRHGDVFAQACTLATCLLVVASFLRRGRAR